MNYELKYKKYKHKYNLLKKGGSPLINNTEIYKQIMNILESNIKEPFPQIDHNLNYGKNNTTYGELQLCKDGFGKIIHTCLTNDVLKPLFEKKNVGFLDPCCGRGLVPLSVPVYDNKLSNFDFKESHGYELAKERVEKGIDIYTNFLNNLLKSVNSKMKIVLQHADSTHIDYSNSYKNCDSLLVWISNLCFSEEISKQIIENICRQLQNRLNIVIFCSKEINNLDNLEKLGKISVKQSWNSNSDVYYYIIKNNSKQSINNDEYIKLIEKLYPHEYSTRNENTAWRINQSQDEIYKRDNIISIYGEILTAGLKDLHKVIDKMEYNPNVFVDFGSGRGKILLYWAQLPSIYKCIGIEGTRERNDMALQNIQNVIKEGYSEYGNKITSINSNFLKEDIYKNLFKSTDKVLVWISNWCFSKETNDGIINIINKYFPSNVIIMCSKELESTNLEKIDKIPALQSWGGGPLDTFTYKKIR
jgi:hypothetical protein